MCVEAARRGARRVLGVDIGDLGIRLAHARMSQEERRLRIELRAYGGDLAELGDERFDVIISKDSFEHYGAMPGTPSAEQMARDMASRLVPHGILLVGFGPLWKAPFGGPSTPSGRARGRAGETTARRGSR